MHSQIEDKFPFVIVIILNWNQRELTLECLDSVMKLDYPADQLQIVIVDNGSMDGSVETIRESWPTVTIIENSQNLGYAGGNNVGVRYALERDYTYLLIINNDIKIDKTCLRHLIHEVESDPKVGIAGPLIYHDHKPDVIQSAGGGLDAKWHTWHIGSDEKDIGQYQDTCEVAWLSGCAMLVNAEAVRKVGLLDERYFCYWEEVDWCVRFRSMGWKIVNVPNAKLWHKGGRSDIQPLPYVTYYMTRNKLLLLKKNRVSFGIWLDSWGGFLRTLMSWTIKPRWRSMARHRYAMRHGLMDFLNQKWGNVSSLK